MDMDYTDLTIGRKIRSTQTGECATIEDRLPSGYLMLRLDSGPEEGDTFDASPAEVLTFWADATAGE